MLQLNSLPDFLAVFLVAVFFSVGCCLLRDALELFLVLLAPIMQCMQLQDVCSSTALRQLQTKRQKRLLSMVNETIQIQLT
jgi:uncharacterized membrane protein YadS